MGVKFRLLSPDLLQQILLLQKSIFSWELTPGHGKISLAVAGDDAGATNLGDTHAPSRATQKCFFIWNGAYKAKSEWREEMKTTLGNVEHLHHPPAAQSSCGVQGGFTGWCLFASQVHPFFIPIIINPWNKWCQEALESPERSQLPKYCTCVEKQECLNVWGSSSSSSGISLRTPVKITWIACRLTWENPSLINTIRNRGQRTKFSPGLSLDKDLQGNLAGNV